MALQVEEAVDDSVGAQEALRPPGRAEAAHATLPDPGRLVGQFRPIVRMAIVAVDRLRHQFLAGDAMADQLVGHDLSGVRAMRPEQPPEESPSRLGVFARPQIHVNDVAVLIHGRRETVPLTGVGGSVHAGLVAQAGLIRQYSRGSAHQVNVPDKRPGVGVSRNAGTSAFSANQLQRWSDSLKPVIEHS